MTALLHQLGGGRQIPVDRAVVLVGRSAECDAVLDCSTKISRIHCAVVQVDQEYYLRDLGSMNGVWVGGQKVVRQQRLQNGMEVCIGDVRFLFLENVAVAQVTNSTPVASTEAGSATPAPQPAIASPAAADADRTVDERYPDEPQPAAMPRISVEQHEQTLMATAAAFDYQPIAEAIELEVDVEVIEDP
ncbi:MAG: FHA domain-containing protein [Planctomycetota bacterium]